MIDNNQPTEAERAEQVATDLERLAAFVRANPDLAPQIGDQWFLLCLTHEDDPKAAMADVARRARRAGATMRKETTEQSFRALLSFGEITLNAYASREQVCERVVVGTREETITEPDPEAVAALPLVTRTEVVEDVEWRCPPLIAPADEAEEVAAS